MAELDPSLTGASSQGEPGQDSNPQHAINIRPNGLVELIRYPQPENGGLSKPVSMVGHKHSFSEPTQRLIEQHEDSLRADGTVGAIDPTTKRPRIAL